MSITLTSLGGGKISDINPKTIEFIKASESVVLQTAKCEAADYLNGNDIPFLALDKFYETCPDFDELNQKCAKYLTSLENPTFCIIGEIYLNSVVNTLISENTKLAVSSENSHISHAIIGSLADCSNGVNIISASSLTEIPLDTNSTICITELGSVYLASDVKLKLSISYDDETDVFLYKNTVAKLKLFELDRQDKYDHLTTLVIPKSPVLNKKRFSYSDLIRICEILRSKNGCPWDRDQTHESLMKCLQEECSEVVDALNSGNIWHFCEELGDVLLQIALNGQIAIECGEFNHTDITTHICQKLLRRHPHVFGDKKALSPDDAISIWKEMKNTEKQK